MTLLLLVGALTLLIVLRVPVAIALLATSLGYVFLSDTASIRIALQQTVGGIDSFPLLAVPFFILLGMLANEGGISERLFNFADAFVGRVRGGLGYVNVGVSTLFSWMSGAAVADAAGLGAMLIPQMVRRGYDRGFAVGLTGASALIGPLMPPSIPAIIYAVTAGVSIAGLFAAGVVPALLLAALICANVAIYGRLMGRLADVAPRDPQRWVRRARATGSAVPALVTPVLVIGGILAGIVTPTEAAAVGVLYIMVLGLAYRSMDLRKLSRVVVESATTTAGIMIIIGSAGLFGWILAREGGARLVQDVMTGVTDSPIVFLLLVNLLLLVVGTFLEATAAILILVPILQPIAIEFGIDPLHFGIIVLMNLFIGLLTPPVGVMLYVLASVSNTPVREVIRGVLPFLVTLAIALLLFTYIPQISLTLPRMLGVGG